MEKINNNKMLMINTNSFFVFLLQFVWLHAFSRFY